MRSEQLRALVAVLDEGTFEGAASELKVTPSAISQRMKALESAVGQVLVNRATPCSPTPAGEILVRMARQVALLEAEAWAELGGTDETNPVRSDCPPAQLRVAVNADSLATWFPKVFAAASRWPDVVLHLEIEDQDHSLALLRAGEVVAVVTTQAKPLAGCDIVPLGAMRYVPVASPVLRDRLSDYGHWSRLPEIRFNTKDDLQERFRHKITSYDGGPVTQIPSSEGFLAGIVAGLGWGMVPEGQLGTLLDDGLLVPLSHEALDVMLYWQHWRLASPRIERLTREVREAAANALNAPRHRPAATSMSVRPSSGTAGSR